MKHWDQYAHFPTLRKYFLKKKLFIPTFNSKKTLSDTLEKNFQVQNATPNKWFNISDISYMSIPLYNDDSMLLFRYDNYLICNINDSKPTPQIIDQILTYKKLNKLDIILMQSYAPASINNSFRRVNFKKIILKSKEDYVKYVMKVSKKLNAK